MPARSGYPSVPLRRLEAVLVPRIQLALLPTCHSLYVYDHSWSRACSLPACICAGQRSVDACPEVCVCAGPERPTGRGGACPR
jgi:hypothetical protein